jgi:hypothetical protein
MLRGTIMKRTMRILPTVIVGLFVSIGCLHAQQSRAIANCDDFNLDGTASQPLANVTLPPAQKCALRMNNGFLLPDERCTPGAINPTLTVDVLRNPSFRTSCVRGSATSEAEKAGTYAWYNIKHPTQNFGATQTCELDHLISLELGGADTLDNLWPQCGPNGATLANRYFKVKDKVENFLAKQVRDGTMTLQDAQRGIASDWTQYIDPALRR